MLTAPFWPGLEEEEEEEVEEEEEEEEEENFDSNLVNLGIILIFD